MGVPPTNPGDPEEEAKEVERVVNYRGRRRAHAPHLVLFAFVVATLAGVERLAHLD